MTHTDEDLLALADSAVDDLLYDAQNDCQFPDYMRIADWLQGPSTLADMRGWIVEATLRVLVAERQAIRDKALEDAAQCCEAEADKCDDAVKWGGAPKYIANCKAAAYAMRDRAYTIRAMKGKPE